MKKKFIILLTFFILLVFLLIPFQIVMAKDKDKPEDHMTEPNVVEKGGVELLIKRYPVSRYMANNEDSDKMIHGAFVGMNNVIFSFAGYIVLVVDTAMDKLYSLEPIDKFADDLTSVSKNIYNTLKQYFGHMLFVFACGYIMYLTVIRGSVKEAIRRAILFFLVLVVGGYWMLNAGFFMKTLNSLSVEAQGYLLHAGNGLIDITDGEGVYADTESISRDEPLEGTISVMRNVYFGLALKRPYLFVNYGETNIGAVNENDVEDLTIVPGKDDFNRVDRLLSFDLSSEGDDHRLGYVKGEVELLDNDNMGGGNVYSQLGQALISLVGSLLLGIPFLLLALFNFILQLLALSLAFFIPFAFVLSYIPQFAYSGFSALGKLLSVFVIKAMLGILILFVYLLTFVVDSLIPPDALGMYLLNLVVLISVMIMMIVKRDSIIKLMTAGKVHSLDGNMMNNVNNNMVNPALQAINKRTGGKRESPDELSNGSPTWRDKVFGKGENDDVSNNDINRSKQSDVTSVKSNNKDDSLNVDRTPQLRSNMDHKDINVDNLEPVKNGNRNSSFYAVNNSNESLNRNRQQSSKEDVLKDNKHLKMVKKDQNVIKSNKKPIVRNQMNNKESISDMKFENKKLSSVDRSVNKNKVNSVFSNSNGFRKFDSKNRSVQLNDDESLKKELSFKKKDENRKS